MRNLYDVVTSRLIHDLEYGMIVFLTPDYIYLLKVRKRFEKVNDENIEILLSSC
jgi:hypothetical protein